MKSLKITLIVVAVFASLVSCTKQDLTEDDVLIDNPQSVFVGDGTITPR
ncbi:hypothetical protein [Flavisericum labens]